MAIGHGANAMTNSDGSHGALPFALEKREMLMGTHQHAVSITPSVYVCVIDVLKEKI